MDHKQALRIAIASMEKERRMLRNRVVFSKRATSGHKKDEKRISVLDDAIRILMEEL